MGEEFDKKYKIYICLKEDCGKAHYTIKALHCHYRDFHKENPKDISIYCKQEEPLDLTCELCGKKYTHKTHFEDHLEEHKVGLGTKLFSCNICESKFHLRTSLKKHLKAHENDTEDTLCSICGITMETKNEMRKHKRKYHNNLSVKKKKVEGIPPVEYNCKFCDFKAGIREHVNTHMYNEHNLGAKFCDLCGKKCRTATQLSIHRQMIHNKGDFICNVCGKKFTCEFNLNRHTSAQHVSDEEKPFKCSKCGKGFATKVILEGHMNMHLGLKPYKCQICGQGFQNNSNMRAHQKKTCKGRSAFS